MRILVINGPNLNLLGTREPDIYGSLDYAGLCDWIRDETRKFGLEEVSFFQSNTEGVLIDAIHSAREKYDALVINPGAYTHYSYAILDALLAVDLPAIEVHISNIHKREVFRHTSVTAPACLGQITGLGIYGYIAAIQYLVSMGKTKGE